MNVDQIAPEATLVAPLRTSIEDPHMLAADRDDAAAITLAEARDAELESGAVQPLSHAELMQRLRK